MEHVAQRMRVGRQTRRFPGADRRDRRSGRAGGAEQRSHASATDDRERAEKTTMSECVKHSGFLRHGWMDVGELGAPGSRMH
jgi:hypothetical protein